MTEQKHDFTHLRFEMRQAEDPNQWWPMPSTKQRNVWDVVQVYVADDNRHLTHEEDIAELRMPESWAVGVVTLLEGMMSSQSTPATAEVEKALDAWRIRHQRVVAAEAPPVEMPDGRARCPRCGGRLRVQMGGFGQGGPPIRRAVCADCGMRSIGG